MTQAIDPRRLIPATTASVGGARNRKRLKDTMKTSIPTAGSAAEVRLQIVTPPHGRTRRTKHFAKV